jgi:pimeloyl-ACP methyl ester carboxylesterase
MVGAMNDASAWLTPERLAHGHVIVLPGIEGYSRWNRRIVRGLLSAGVPFGIEIHDWTLGRLLAPWSLRAARRHREQAELIAQKVAASRQARPQAPVWLIGHSGGGALAVLALERLPPPLRAEGAILLAPAISPGYDLRRALQATRRGLWNYSSWGDAFFLIFGTLLLGTLDGRHTIAAGACGFRPPRPDPTTEPQLAFSSAEPRSRLTEVRWRPAMIRQGHLGGHFGAVHPRFVRDWIAPILMADDGGETVAASRHAGGDASASEGG